MTLFFRGEVEQSLAVGETAARLSPHDPDVLGEVGMRNILSGNLETGISFVHQAIGLDRGVSITSRMALALASLRKGRYQEASDVARGDGQGSNFTYWSLVSAIHGKAGRLEEARAAARELLKLYPDFADWAWEEMAARNVGPELATAMAEGWRAAGLPVPLSGSGSKP
jgi:Flp pilus assembly protein TadD